MKFLEVHYYLSMNLYYPEELILKVSMIEYLKILICEFPEHLDTPALSQADDYIFKVIPDSETK